MEEGILVGCDTNSEWLLPWWLENYSEHNHYPVAFADFGMSERAKEWCLERGIVFELPKEARAPLQEVDLCIKEIWTEILGEGIWAARPSWFLKPYACLHSPFEKTGWIDLDCEIRAGLSPLFQLLDLRIEIALYQEEEPPSRAQFRKLGVYETDEPVYNSGVVFFRKKAQIIRDWVHLAKHQNRRFIGDQDALARAIYLFAPPVFALPKIYNWNMCEAPPPETAILHYCAAAKLLLMYKLNPELFPKGSPAWQVLLEKIQPELLPEAPLL